METQNNSVSCFVLEGTSTPDIGEEAKEDLETDAAEAEDSSCSRLLAAAAERVWDIFMQNKREVRVTRETRE